jgi:hypothetical protein
MKANADQFRLELTFHGLALDQAKHPSVLLVTLPEPEGSNNPHIFVLITKHDAARIVDFLAEDGFLLKGYANSQKLLREPNLPYYAFAVATGNTRCVESYRLDVVGASDRVSRIAALVQNPAKSKLQTVLECWGSK